MQIIGFRFRVAEPEWTYRDHYHKIFEILYCYDGSAVQYNQGRSIAFGREDWLVIPPGMRHHIVNSGPSDYTDRKTRYTRWKPLIESSDISRRTFIYPIFPLI
ncbi:MAG: cupin domain-containing protein [Bacillota bacterium]